MTLRDIKRLGEFPGAGAKAPYIFDASASSHDCKTAPWLDRPNENQAVAWAALDQHVEHPVYAVVEIDVGRARFIALDEGAGARALEGVTRFVALDQIGLRLNDNATAFPPNELGTDQVFSATQWINLEENVRQHAGKIAAMLYGKQALQ